MSGLCGLAVAVNVDREEAQDRVRVDRNRSSVLGRILVGDTTMRYLDGSYRTEDLGSHALKGKQQTTRIYRVSGTS